MRLAAFLIPLALAAPREAAAWGFTAHRLTERRAIAGLPPGPLKDLMANNVEWVAEHAVDPDLWRTTGVPNEFPAHFLDMDSFGTYPFPNIPLVEAEHLRVNGPDAGEKGRLPWRMSEAYDELVASLKARDPVKVLRAASTLGHYVGDAHVPLHAATNYDGQMTGQTGIHARWEDGLVDRYRTSILRSLAPVTITDPGDPVAFAMKTLRDSFRAVAPQLAADKACAKDATYGSAYLACFYGRERKTLVARMSATSSAIASFWQAAWIAAGRPALDARSRYPYVRGKSKAILATLDGAPGPLIDDAIGRGVMPHLAALRARGVGSNEVRVSIPAKTSTGHATLYTGTWPDDHGITGNDFVPATAALDASISGFTSAGLEAEPLWVTAAGQGLRVIVAQATQISPFDPYFEEKRFGGNFSRNLTLINGFQAFDAPDVLIRGREASCGAGTASWASVPKHNGALRECRFDVGGTAVYGLFFDDPKRATKGFDSLLLSPDRNASGRSVIHADPLAVDASAFGQVAIKVSPGNVGVFFRLYELESDGSDFLLYRARVRMLRSSRPAGDADALAQTGGTVGNGAIDVYRDGAFGQPLWRGGDGTAERRYLETVALAIRQSTRIALFAAERAPWDMLVTYVAYPDEALHLWLGRIDPSLASYDARLAARLRPYVDQVLRLSDAFVGELKRLADARTIVAIATDHGLVGVDKIFRPNVVLAQAGLLATTERGGLDLSKTRALYPGSSGYVVVNRASRQKGIVAEKDVAGVVDEIVKALVEVKDEGGDRIVTKTMVPGRDSEPGIGGSHGGNVYLDVKPGFAASGGLQGARSEKAAAPFGDHLFGPDRPWMKGALSIAGPGVAHVDLGPLLQIDIAPTLCHLLGLDPPAQAKGAVVEGALARKPLK